MRSVDLAEALKASVASGSPVVRSLMDIDFYKFTMGQLIHKHFRHVQVTFKLIVRSKDVAIGAVVSEEELRKHLDYVLGLSFAKTDLYYLRGMNLYQANMFSEEYLGFLRTLKLPSYTLKRVGEDFELTFTGSWPEVTMWETIALAIISELYYRALLKDLPIHELRGIYDRARTRVREKLEKILRHPGIRFADFSQRRRHSFLWQEWVIGECRDTLGAQFTGTSNTWMAFHHNLDPIGTNAHELPMALTALANSIEEMLYAQYRVYELWQEMYGQGLRIILPDTYGSAQFYAKAPDWLASWRGQRQDSGDPIAEGERYIAWLARKGEDPAKHVSLFTDGLDVDPMIRIHEHFGNRHPHAYGWGTLVGNDFEGCARNVPLLKPISMVCKVVDADGRECVKLSNNVNKATGSKKEIARYLEIFGAGDRIAQNVIV